MSKLLLSALWNNCCYHLQTSNAVCLKGFLKSRYRAVSEFLWWIRGEADASSRVRTSNAETDKMAYGVWNYLMWLKSCLCQRLTLVSVSHIRSYRSSHRGNAKPPLGRSLWEVSLNCQFDLQLSLKEQFTKKWKFAKTLLYTSTLRPAEMQVSLFLLHIWRNSALNHLLSNGCSAVNGCRQNESPNSWSKKSQVIHTTPVHQLILRSKKLHVYKK